MSDLRAGLSPVFLIALDAVLEEMAKSGHPMKLCQGLRTAEQQHARYLQGRDPAHPGKLVTNCDGYAVKSNHQPHVDGFGHAADCCFLGPDPFGAAQPWAAFGTLAESQGLRWGGRFRLVDLDHVEMQDLPLPAHA